MPIPELVYQQVAKLCAFFEPSETRLWVFRHLRDLQPAVHKILAGIQNDEANGNVFFYCDAAFLAAEQYCGRVLEQFEQELNELVIAFAVGGIVLPAPMPQYGTVTERLARRCDAVADKFPEGSGSLVLILDPTTVSDESRLAAALVKLAEQAKSPRCKFLLLDGGTAPALEKLRELGGQNFRLDPAAIEAQVAADLAGDELTPPERRQYMAMAGSFAFSKGQIAQAVELQSKVLALAVEADEPQEAATALFSLGNTHLKAKKPAEAEIWFTKAVEVCLAVGNDNLLGMVLLNLGIALHRQGKKEEAIRSFDIGRETFRALKQLPGEVHALDTKAAALAEAKQTDAARRVWEEAIDLVNGITNDGFAQLRASCLEDLGGKLRAVSSAGAI